MGEQQVPNHQSSQTVDLLPVGCCFMPTEKQLVSHYLFNHISGLPLQNHPFCPVPVFFCDLYGSEEPWELWDRFQSQNSSGLSTGDDVYLITKLKHKKVAGKQLKQKKMAGSSNKQNYDRFLGTSGGNWHRSDKDYKIEVDRDDFVGVRKKFSYKNLKSNQHGLWLLSEYSISYDGGKTCSEDVICILKDHRKSDESATTKKRKFEEVNATTTAGLPSSSKVPKLDDGATSSATLMQMQTKEMLPISFDFSMPSPPNVLDASSVGDIIHNNEPLPTIPSHHSVDDTSGSESGHLDNNDIYIDYDSIWALLEDDSEEPEDSGLLEQVQSSMIKLVQQSPSSYITDHPDSGILPRVAAPELGFQLWKLVIQWIPYAHSLQKSKLLESCPKDADDELTMMNYPYILGLLLSVPYKKMKHALSLYRQSGRCSTQIDAGKGKPEDKQRESVGEGAY